MAPPLILLRAWLSTDGRLTFVTQSLGRHRKKVADRSTSGE